MIDIDILIFLIDYVDIYIIGSIGSSYSLISGS